MIGGIARPASPRSINVLRRPTVITSSSLILSFGEIDAERSVDRFVRAQEMVIHLHGTRLLTQLRGKGLKVLQVLLPQSLRIDEHFLPGDFQIAELGPL